MTCCDVSSTPYVHATNTCACDILVIVFILMRIRPSTQIRSRYECVFILIHFQERFQIDAFTTKTLIVLVRTEGLNASKRMRFQNARAPNEKRRKSEMKRFSFPSLISGLPLDLAFTHDRFAGRSKWRACSLASVYSRHVFGASN